MDVAHIFQLMYMENRSRLVGRQMVATKAFTIFATRCGRNKKALAARGNQGFEDCKCRQLN